MTYHSGLFALWQSKTSPQFLEIQTTAIFTLF
jgi:hypothetical protein